MIPGMFDPFTLGNQTNEDGTPITPGIKPPRIFAESPNYGGARYGPSMMMPRDTSFDSILAENEARLRQSERDLAKARGATQDSYSSLMAKMLRGPGGEQAPAPVFDASPTSVFHFDP